LLNAIGLTPGGISTVHIYTQTIHRITQLIWEERGSCPVFASYTLAFALQRRKKHGKTSVRVAQSQCAHILLNHTASRFLFQNVCVFSVYRTTFWRRVYLWRAQ